MDTKINEYMNDNNLMEEYKDNEADETLSLSDLQMDGNTTSLEEVNQTFYQDFFGFPVVDDNIRNPPRKVKETNPAFRSSSGSFRYMRLKIGSRKNTLRSKSVSVMASSKSKSRWQVFMYGSGKFPTKMDLFDIKSRQLRSQSTTKVPQCVDHVVSREESVGRGVSRKKLWWRFVDVLGCDGGYEKDTKVDV